MADGGLADPVIASTTDSAENPNCMPPRILLVDDEEDLLGIVAEVIRASGLEVTALATGREARDLIHAGPSHDVAIIDWTIPDVKGRDLVLLLAASWPECRVLITTGHSGDVISDAVIGPTVHGILRKPFTMSSLRSRIHDVLGTPQTGGPVKIR